MYGQSPPKMLLYEVGSTSVQAVEEKLRNWEFIAKLIKENLKEAQARMKYFTNRKRPTLDLKVGEMVYLRLRTYRRMMVAMQRTLKIPPRYYGPFKIVRKVGHVTY